MSDGFETMVDAAQAFFGELKGNNEKSWFEARKDHYTDDIRKPAELFAGLVAEDLSRRTDQAHAAKVFRIYRDVRFSKDKTPYNTHLHILWSTGAAGTPGWFFAIEPDSIWMGIGLIGLQGEMLTRYRQMIDAHGAELSGLIDGLRSGQGAEISDYGPEPLKRVPKPYDPDHPQGDLLRRKGFAIGAELAPDWRKPGLVKAVGQTAEAYLPLWQLIGSRI